MFTNTHTIWVLDQTERRIVLQRLGMIIMVATMAMLLGCTQKPTPAAPADDRAKDSGTFCCSLPDGGCISVTNGANGEKECESQGGTPSKNKVCKDNKCVDPTQGTEGCCDLFTNPPNCVNTTRDRCDGVFRANQVCNTTSGRCEDCNAL